MDFVSYAQNFEDVMLWRALQHVGTGVYVDIGAQDPVADSVSRAFYLQGWRGVHVEPNHAYAEALRRDRPDETVIEAAVGRTAGLMDFFEFAGTGLSTAVAGTMAAHEAAGWVSAKTVVPVVTLDSLLAQVDAPEIHWLKIDVEGFETEVLAGWTDTARLPWIVVVEALAPNGRTVSADWEPLLLAKGYAYAYFDGLNRYYVSPLHPELAGHFQYGPCLWDGFQLPDVARPVRQLTTDFAEKLAGLAEERDRLAGAAEDLQGRLSVTEAKLRSAGAQAERLEAEIERLSPLAQRVEALTADLHFAHVSLNAEREERDQLRRQMVAAEAAWRRRYMRLATLLERVVGSRWWRLRGLFRPTETWLAAVASDVALDRDPAPSRPHPEPARSLQALLSLRGHALIESAFITLLGRAPDESGRIHFTGRIALGASAEDIVAEIRTSPEGKAVGTQLPGLDRLLANDRRRRRRWRRVLDRLTGRSPGALRPFANLPSPHLLAETAAPAAASVDDLLRLSDTAFVRCAYVSILGRDADPDGLETHVTRLQLGEDRLTQLASLRGSAEGVAYRSTLPGLDRATRWWRYRHIPPLAHLLKAIEQIRRGPAPVADRLADISDRLDRIAAVLGSGAPAPGSAVPLVPSAPPPPRPDGRAAAVTASESVAAIPPPPEAAAPPPVLSWALSDPATAAPAEGALLSALAASGQRVLEGRAGADLEFAWSADPTKRHDPGAPALLLGIEPQESELTETGIIRLTEDWAGVGCLTRTSAKALLDHGLDRPVAAIDVGLDDWDALPASELADPPRQAFRFLHRADPDRLADTARLIEAFGELFRRGDDVILVLSAADACRAAVEELVDAHHSSRPDPANLAARFGPADDATFKALLATCTVFVDPSVRTRFPWPLARALQAGRPVIAAAYGAARDLCDARSAWLVDYRFVEPEGSTDTAPVLAADVVPTSLRDRLWQAYRASPEDLAARGAAARVEAARRFTWVATARAVAELGARSRAARADARSPWLGVVTTWNVKCGIAAASAELLAQTPVKDVTIFAARQEPRIAEDGSNCIRAWDPGKARNNLDEVRDHVVRRKIEAVIIQFNYGFFNHRELDAFIRDLKARGVIVFVILHSTTDPMDDVENYRLSDLSAALSVCDRVIGHSIADLNRMKVVSTSNNLLLSPLGVGAPAPPRYALADPQTPALACFGFCFENKGLLELVEAVDVLRSRGQPVRLTMLNAVHTDPSSARMADRLDAAIARRGLSEAIRFVRDFLPIEEVIRRIGEADIVVNPYQMTGESASAAIRTGMRANRLTVVTPLPIFDELGPAVIRTPGIGPAEMADGIQRAVQLLRSQSDELKALEAAAQAWLRFNSYERQGRRLTTMIRALHNTQRPLTQSGSDLP